jgi:hypothetical protein
MGPQKHLYLSRMTDTPVRDSPPLPIEDDGRCLSWGCAVQLAINYLVARGRGKVQSGRPGVRLNEHLAHPEGDVVLPANWGRTRTTA